MVDCEHNLCSIRNRIDPQRTVPGRKAQSRSSFVAVISLLNLVPLVVITEKLNDIEKDALLDSLRVLYFFHPKKKLRIAARAAYKRLPKPLWYEPLQFIIEN